MFRKFLGASNALPARLMTSRLRASRLLPSLMTGLLARTRAGGAQAVDRLKIGFRSTLSGPGAARGSEVGGHRRGGRRAQAGDVVAVHQGHQLRGPAVHQRHEVARLGRGRCHRDELRADVLTRG